SEDIKSLKVIATSASVISFKKSKAQQHGFDDFLPKPYSIADVVNVLSKLLPHQLNARSSSKGNIAKQQNRVLSEDDLIKFNIELKGLAEKNDLLKKQQPMEEVSYFIKELDRVSNEFEITELNDYSKKLNSAMDNFDVGLMLSTINEFSSLKSKLQNIFKEKE
ncbi:MAG: response regulator, partial [Bacteroidales bacterium]|nr:response regulator [Bacteroidales bacterium]